MKFRHGWYTRAASTAALLLAGASACGDDESTSSGSGGTGGSSSQTEGAGAGDNVELAKPPSRPDGATAGDGPGAFLAISAFYLGDTDRSGTPSPTAWEGIGFDLDGQATGDDLGDHCAPVGGDANAGSVVDGAAGVDNSFGKNVMPLLDAILPDASAAVTEAVEEGSFTVALHMRDLGSGSTYDPISTHLFAGLNGESGTWQYAPDLLNGGDPEDPKIRFEESYVNDDTWVSGEPESVPLSLSILGVDLALTIEQATIAVDLSADRTSGSNGVIVGVLDTEVFVAEIEKVASALGGDIDGLCPGDPLLEGILANIRNASDILNDGTNRGGVPCDGISIAIGFDMVTTAFGDVAEPGTPAPSSCEE